MSISVRMLVKNDAQMCWAQLPTTVDVRYIIKWRQNHSPGMERNQDINRMVPDSSLLQ